MKFTHLHVHSHYSLLDGLPKIEEFLDYVQELNMDSAALTDHGVLYGAVEFYKKAKKRNIKPIIGVETYLAFERMAQKRPHVDDKRYHLVLLVKNEEGYKNLIKLISKAHLEGFYYKPRIDEELLAQYSNGLIALSACLQGKIPQLIMAKKLEEAKKTAQRYKEIFGKDNFYLELQHHPGIKEQGQINQVLKKFSKELKIPLVATNDVHYLKPEDAEAQDVLMLINTGARLDDPERLTMKASDFSLRKPEQMIKDFKDVPEAIENTQKIVDSCNFEFKFGEIKLPHFNTPDDKTPDEYLEELCSKGMKIKYDKEDKKITDRLNHELDIIKKMGFASYFLIVQDFVNWAKEQRIIVGPGRGSVAGSLVSYLLNITTVDPLKYNLLFERFLNPARVSPPDIDLDFTDRRRDEVINYVSQKYGRNKVAQIITFGTMASRAAIRDVGRALGYPYATCDKIAKMIPMGLSLDKTLNQIREFKAIYEQDDKARELIDFAKKLEGRARHASTHACGVVVSDKPLDNLVPLQYAPQNSETVITQYEMHAIEDLGLLKIDFLGLKNLTIIEHALALIHAVQNISLDIENIPLNDKKTYKLLQAGETTGVFQLESSGLRAYLKQLKPTEFEDISIILALYRPGPIKFIPEYISRKHKRKKIKYLHPKLKPILEKTQGICVFQEQLMQIARELAGFSLSEADILRKAVGKKIKSLLSEQKEKMINGMRKNGINEETAKKIWEWILPFARYGFNQAHSCSYATIAYQTAYLKAHFKVEFMAALLASEKHNMDKIAVLIRECENNKIKVLPPDINESFINFSVIPKKNKIRFGLMGIKNVGENIVNTIISERKANGPYQSIEDFASRIESKNLNKKSIQSLIQAGVFDAFEERGKLLQNLELILQFNREVIKNRDNQQKNLFGDSLKCVHSLKLKDTAPAPEHEKLKWEKELLGLYISGHPLKSFQKILNKKAIALSSIKDQVSAGKIVKIGGIISSLKKILTKNGKPMFFIGVEDLTDKIEVVVFPKVVERNYGIFQEDKIVFIKGRINERDGIPKIICESIEEVVEDQF